MSNPFADGSQNRSCNTTHIWAPEHVREYVRRRGGWDGLSIDQRASLMACARRLEASTQEEALAGSITGCTEKAIAAAEIRAGLNSVTVIAPADQAPEPA